MSAPSNREETIFERALGMDSPQAREAYLRDACGDDMALRERLQGLLAAHDRAGRFLEHAKPVAAPRESAASFALPPGSPEELPALSRDAATNVFSEKPGDRIGRYKLLEQIGEGGMGTVWMAEQEEPVRRRVALKVIKLGMDTRQVLARFEAERQALALMDHPNIARVFDGGATGAGGAESQISNLKSQIPAGRPYFVMELVRGLPITKYCDEAKLSTRQRLELFGQVCRAVQHAHQKGIIHRDLKPSNILVTVQDDRPVVKVIDFGIAKATEGRLTDKTLFTGFDQLMGTPSYMSPEQAGLGSLDIDTRSDTYSLGVVLYELLTGRPPFDTKELLKSGYEAVLRTIREVDPPKPSTRLTDLVAADVRRLHSKSEIRNPKSEIDRASSRRRLQEVRGDLDWIVMKCLEKDRARRYETANGLAQDLERYLHDEPVLARPPSTGYRLRKFVKKHRGPVAAAAGFVVLLVAATAVSVGLAMWANQERDRAEKAQKAEAAQRQAAETERNRATSAETKAKENEKQARKAESEAKSVLRFFGTNVLAAPRPGSMQRGGLGRNVTLREAVDAAEPKIAKSFSEQPLVEAAIREWMGETYQALGDSSLAIPQFKRAFTLWQDRRGTNHDSTLAAMNNLALATLEAGQLTNAVPLLQEALRLYQANFGSDDPETLKVMNNLALAYFKADRKAEALPIAKQVLELRKATLGTNDPATLRSMQSVGVALMESGQFTEALPLLRDSLASMRIRPGPDASDTLTAIFTLGEAWRRLGETATAIPLLEQALRGLTNKFGDGHSIALATQISLGRAYNEAGRFTEGLPLLERAVETRRTRSGPDDTRTLQAMHALGQAYVRAGRYDDGLALFGKVLDSRNVKPGPNHTETLSSMMDVGWGQLHAGRFDTAETLLRQCLEILERQELGEMITAHANGLLGWSMLGQKKFAEAEPLLVQYYEALKRQEAERDSPTRIQDLKEAGERIVELYEAWGKPDQAAEWRAKLKAPVTPPANVQP